MIKEIEKEIERLGPQLGGVIFTAIQRLPTRRKGLHR